MFELIQWGLLLWVGHIAAAGSCLYSLLDSVCDANLEGLGCLVKAGFGRGADLGFRGLVSGLRGSMETLDLSSCARALSSPHKQHMSEISLYSSLDS